MNTWKVYMSEGSSAYQQAQWHLALSKYKQAMSTAERAFPKQLKKNADTALASIVVVFFNLADTYMCLMHYSQARQQYEQCFGFLEQQLKHNNSDPGLNEAIARAYSQVRTEWFLFKKQRERRINLPDPPELERIENNLQKNSFKSVHCMH